MNIFLFVSPPPHVDTTDDSRSLDDTLLVQYEGRDIFTLHYPAFFEAGLVFN